MSLFCARVWTAKKINYCYGNLNESRGTKSGPPWGSLIPRPNHPQRRSLPVLPAPLRSGNKTTVEGIYLLTCRMDGCIALCTDQRATQDCEKKKISSESDDQTIKVWQRRNSPNWALQVLLYFSEGFPNFFYIFRESHTTPYNDKQK